MSRTLLSRRRNVPWIQRWSRVLIGTIALLGALNTAYLTINRFTSTATACPTSGCEQVLSSPYATVFGLPLALFGLLAYLGMAVFALAPLAVKPEENKQLRSNLETWTWLLLFAGSTAMLIFSGYLMNIMVSQFVVKFGPSGVCYYCIASAIFALALFILTLLGRVWEDIGQLFVVGFTVAIVTLIGTLGVYANINSPQTAQGPGAVGPAIVNESGPAEIALAKHLTATGAKMYEAYWCPHCHDQKELFGQQASGSLNRVECAKDGRNSQTELCIAANVESFPTWELKGQKYPGTKKLQELADLSGYTGPRDFRNRG
ncbi:MAG TPA: vitamin K epoxide reductase family protein [Thermosynechococcaceae cyanobacterium]